MSLDLSIQIVNWNAREHLRQCLRSILEHPPSVPYEILVLDNASWDGSAQMLEKEFPEVRLLVSEQNLGFSKGHNLLAQGAQGRYLFILNPDTLVMPDALDKLVAFADAYPQGSQENDSSEVPPASVGNPQEGGNYALSILHSPQSRELGIVGPKILNPDGSLQYSCRTFPNPVAALFRNTPLGKLFPHNRYTREYLMTDWDHNSVREVDWVSGSAMLVRKSVYDQLGGFDEQFFMYCEDMDLCYRAWQAGYKVVYYPEAVIIHAIGRSTDLVANRMIRTFHLSMYRYYKKHYARRTPFWIRPLVPTGLVLRASLFLLKNEKDAFLRWLGRFKRTP